ncbi:MAG TPA: BatA domain-containing protein [Vicinamibacterales bacterium]|nr:BatA domain-containing protein [Vicinamibacterales bacterium]
MVWLDPGALWALTFAAGPILVHLLRSRRALRVPFPSTRFVRATAPTSVRLRPPSDRLLLAVRVAIVALGACALAQPLILTAARAAAWNARVARVVVLDTSDSMGLLQTGGTASRAEAAVGPELAGASAVRRIETPDLAAGILSALAWLETAPPARLELVVVSDFQLHALAASGLAHVPQHVGIRLVRVGDRVERRQVEGGVLFKAPGVPARRLEIEISPTGTSASFDATDVPDVAGLTLVAPSDRTREADALLDAVARAGSPAPRADQPVIIRFTGAPPGPEPERAMPPWMLQTLARLTLDTQLLRLARGIHSQPLSAGDARVVVLRDSSRKPLVQAAAVPGGLELEVGADVATYFAAALVRGALQARRGSAARAEEEVRTLDDDTLLAWSRPAGDAPPEAWRNAESSDARWCWLFAILLLGIEAWLRGLGSTASAGERRDAAA